MSADRADALKAVDEAFTEGVKHLYAVFVQGLIGGEPSDGLKRHFTNGLAHHCDTHGKTTAAVIDYFQGEKP